MFTGLSAFPLTPVTAAGVDEEAFCRLLARLTAAKVDAIGALGSTGSYAYLTRAQRERVAALAVAQAEGIPVMVSIGATATDEVLRLADDAQRVGVSALLLPPVSYQTLTEEEVYRLFATVAQQVSVPICLYDNPGTTHFTFTPALYARIAALDGVSAIKMPGVPAQPDAARAHIAALRQALPADVSLGVSGDAFAGLGLNAGCDVWFSVCGGLFPQTAKAITLAASRGDAREVTRLSDRLTPLWDLFRQHGGSLRVMAAAACALGLMPADALPRPLLPLSAAARADVAAVVSRLELA